MKNDTESMVIMVVGALMVIAAYVVPAIAITFLIFNSDWNAFAKTICILYLLFLMVRTFQLGQLLREAKSYKS